MMSIFLVFLFLIKGKYLDKGNYAQVYECIKKDNNQRHAVKVL